MTYILGMTFTTQNVSFSPMMLKLVREQAGESQEVVAEAVGVKQSQLCKYEKGQATPSDGALENIASHFGYTREYFLRDYEDVASGLVFHRKRASLTAKERDRIEAEARLRVIDLAVLARPEAETKLPAREGRSPAEMAQCVREAWKIPAGPINELALALESHAVLILYFDFGTTKIDGFFMPRYAGSKFISIALNANDAIGDDRRRFTLAHELGHAVLHGDSFPDENTEREADAFASEFLMPSEDIREDLMAPMTWTHLTAMKRKWGVSMAALVHRAGELGLQKEAALKRTWVYLASLGYKKKEPDCDVTLDLPQGTVKMLCRLLKKMGPGAFREMGLTKEKFVERYPYFVFSGGESP
ncbi:MAG: ImmA/IrrE family metallo-endopeptidase [Kiritimatiellae bacterium]|nr:ImmA/IrrE family metallo-endopeptidase [Kiritimatiellia bacterium]